MRSILTGIVALSFVTVSAVPAAAEPDHTEANYAYLLEALRAEAARHGMALPDLAGETATGTVLDTGTGALREVEVPGDAALRQVASALSSVDLASLGASPDLAGVPTTGVGNNVHGYAHLRLFQCGNWNGYTVEFQAPAPVPPVPGPYYLPNPAFPLVPVFGAAVWGGPVVHVSGGGWLLGAHVFLGAPADVNVHVSGTSISPFLSAGLDSSIDSVAAARIGMVTIPVRFFGICLFSISLGYILENGALAVNGRLLPAALPI